MAVPTSPLQRLSVDLWPSISAYLHTNDVIHLFTTGNAALRTSLSHIRNYDVVWKKTRFPDMEQVFHSCNSLLRLTTSFAFESNDSLQQVLAFSWLNRLPNLTTLRLSFLGCIRSVWYGCNPLALWPSLEELSLIDEGAPALEFKYVIDLSQLPTGLRILSIRSYAELWYVMEGFADLPATLEVLELDTRSSFVRRELVDGIEELDDRALKDARFWQHVTLTSLPPRLETLKLRTDRDGCWTIPMKLFPSSLRKFTFKGVVSSTDQPRHSIFDWSDVEKSTFSVTHFTAPEWLIDCDQLLTLPRSIKHVECRAEVGNHALDPDFDGRALRNLNIYAKLVTTTIRNTLEIFNQLTVLHLTLRDPYNGPKLPNTITELTAADMALEYLPDSLTRLGCSTITDMKATKPNVENSVPLAFPPGLTDLAVHNEPIEDLQLLPVALMRLHARMPVEKLTELFSLSEQEGRLPHLQLLMIYSNAVPLKALALIPSTIRILYMSFKDSKLDTAALERFRSSQVTDFTYRFGLGDYSNDETFKILKYLPRGLKRLYFRTTSPIPKAYPWPDTLEKLNISFNIQAALAKTSVKAIRSLPSGLSQLIITDLSIAKPKFTAQDLPPNLSYFSFNGPMEKEYFRAQRERLLKNGSTSKSPFASGADSK